MTTEIHSGRFAAVDGETTVQNWSIGISSTPQAHVASNTRGGTLRLPGVKDWSGSFSCLGASPTRMPGDIFAFKGYTAPTSDVDGEAGATYSGDAIVDQVVITWNWENGEAINISTNFSAVGAVTESDEAITDVSDPTVFSPLGLRWTLGPDEDSSDVDDMCLTNASLTITAANQAYVNSCTDGWTSRKPGPIDWTGVLNMHNSSGLALPFDIGDDIVLYAYTDDTKYWILKWAHVISFTGITADTKGTIIAMAINLGMNGFNPTVGQIRLPGAATDWWPA